jgi:hypothetical protein
MREDALKPQPNEAPQRKRRRNVVPVLGAAGLSLSLASAASAAISGMSEGLSARTAPVSQQMTLHDEEITDVSLATFQVFEKENTQRPRTRFAACGCGACGADLYYNAPVSGAPAYQPPPPVRTTNKYRRTPRRT